MYHQHMNWTIFSSKDILEKKSMETITQYEIFQNFDGTENYLSTIFFIEFDGKWLMMIETHYISGEWLSKARGKMRAYGRPSSLC